MASLTQLLSWLASVSVFLSVSVCAYKVDKFSFLMPHVNPTSSDMYLCTPIKVEPNKPYYLVGFEPNATMETAHHILLYGCGLPGSSRPMWDCGEMAKMLDSDTDDHATPCKPGAISEIMYAWGRDAPALHLPEGVGFKIGGDSPVHYLVLQVHYLNVDRFKGGSTDDSGLFLHYTERKLDKLAGVLLLGTAGAIPPRKVEHMETECRMEEPKKIHPFAFRTHTHELGRVVTGYRVREKEDGEDEWTLIGKMDPRKPQMFYPVANNVTIRQGDRVASRCTMVSDRDRWTKVGPTHMDEMCNFYIMYYVEGNDLLDMKYCFSRGPPGYYWSTNSNLNHIPDTEASSLD